MRTRADMTCDAVRDRLDPLLDGDLSRREEQSLDRHLESCPACRDELRLARSLRTALRDGMPTLACPPEVTAEVLRIAREEAHAAPVHPAVAPAGPLERIRRWLGTTLAAFRPAESPVARWAAVAALLLVVVAVPFAIREIAVPTGDTQQAERPAPPQDRGSDRTADSTPDPLADPRRDQDPSAADRASAPGYSDHEIARAEREARLVLAAVAQVSRGAGQTIRDQVIEEALVLPARRAVARLDGGGGEDARGAGRQP